jgi:hypothetical protein
MRFFILSVTVNAALVHGLALRPSITNDVRSQEHTEVQHLERALPAVDVASSSNVALRDAVPEGQAESTALAVRHSGTTDLAVRQSESCLKEREIDFREILTRSR